MKGLTCKVNWIKNIGTEIWELNLRRRTFIRFWGATFQDIWEPIIHEVSRNYWIWALRYGYSWEFRTDGLWGLVIRLFTKVLDIHKFWETRFLMRFWNKEVQEILTQVVHEIWYSNCHEFQRCLRDVEIRLEQMLMRSRNPPIRVNFWAKF
jgi:hypothetical protein